MKKSDERDSPVSATTRGTTGDATTDTGEASCDNATAQETGEEFYSYRDHSHVPPPDDDDQVPSVQISPQASEISIRSERFPVKLYTILAQPEYNHIITWMPHGRSWKVLNISLFEREVMPLYFDTANYHSFNRLVNAWSFRRVGHGSFDHGSYYHELFLRGLPHLHKGMHRLQREKKKKPMQSGNEPDLYKMSELNPLPELPRPNIAPMDNMASGNTLTMIRGIQGLGGMPLTSASQPLPLQFARAAEPPSSNSRGMGMLAVPTNSGQGFLDPLRPQLQQLALLRNRPTLPQQAHNTLGLPGAPFPFHASLMPSLVVTQMLQRETSERLRQQLLTEELLRSSSITHRGAPSQRPDGKNDKQT